jgi:hypothetical protein
VTLDNPPRYVPYEPPAPPPPPDPRRRRLLVAVGCAWALVLLVGAVWYAWDGKPSVREQTTVAEAQSTVDRAIGQVVGAAGTGVVAGAGVAAGTGVVAAVTGYDKTDSCQITPVRPGAEYDREVWLATAAGSEPALLDRIAAGLPASYHPVAVHPTAPVAEDPTQGHRLNADAGDYVEITGSIDRSGLVLVVASTGCRPVGRPPAADPSAPPSAGQRARIAGMLDALGITGVRWSTHRLPCGLRTVEADGVPHQTLDALPASSPPPLVAGDGVYARSPGLLARLDGDQATVTFTDGTCDH